MHAENYWGGGGRKKIGRVDVAKLVKNMRKVPKIHAKAEQQRQKDSEKAEQFLAEFLEEKAVGKSEKSSKKIPAWQQKIRKFLGKIG